MRRAPRGAWTSTTSPGPAPISARAIGDSALSLPVFASASVEPTSVHVCSRPVSSSAIVTVAPNWTVAASASASTT